MAFGLKKKVKKESKASTKKGTSSQAADAMAVLKMTDDKPDDECPFC